MNELQEMQERIAQLEQETRTLKSKGKAQSVRQRFVFILAVVGVGTALITHNGNTQAKGQANTVVCQQLKIVDAEGTVLMSLGSTKDAEGQISVYNSNEKRVVVISATTETGEGGVWISDDEGNNTASLRSQDGKGVLWTKK